MKKFFVGAGIATAIALVAFAGIQIATAALTFNGTGISGDSGVAVDGSGTITIGTSSSTAITIGRSGITATFPGTVTITGSTTTLQNLVVSGTCTGCGVGNFTAGGDLSGSSTAQKVIGLQGQPISSTTPLTNQVLTWNGTFWTPANVSTTGGISSINGLSNSTTSIVGAGNITVSTSSPNIITITGTGSGAITINSLATSTFQIQGTANQITVATSSPNIISLSLPQSIGMTSIPTFGGLTINGNATTTNLTITGLGTSGSNCLTVNAAGNVATTTCGSGGTPGGSNTQIQYNNGGSFGGDANLTWSSSTAMLTIASSSGSFLLGTSTLPANALFVVATSSNILTILNNGKVGVGTTAPLSPLTIGDAGVSTGHIENVLVEAKMNTTGHAYTDASQVTIPLAGSGYSSFNAGASILGTVNYDHYAAFQAGSNYIASGTINRIYGLYIHPTIEIGTTTNLYGVEMDDAASTGVITNQYGVYINSLSRGAKNYAIYTASSTPSMFNGVINQAGSAVGTYTGVHIQNWDSATGDGAAIGLGSWGVIGSDLARIEAIRTNASTGGDTDLRFSVYNSGSLKEGLRIMSNGNVGIGTSAPSTTLDIAPSASSTVRIGTGQTNPGCIELYDAANGTLDYVYSSSTALVDTTTKPIFCQ